MSSGMGLRTLSWAMAGGWKELEAAALACGSVRLTVIPTSLPHAYLFPACHLCLHCASAGTCAAALKAGISQIVCPRHFDQFAWVIPCGG